ncbi:MAG: gliding motility-associated C-terminal domain-containing protein [Saprospiraceae bacterium]
MHTSNQRLHIAAALCAIFLSFPVLNPVAIAQQAANHWYFGYRAGLDFSTGVPVQANDGAIDAFEGCATMSDRQGSLLFYTNGGGASPNLSQINGPRNGYIWNRNHDVLYDMDDSEGGGYSAGQSALILPVIGSDQTYYVFTMDQQASLIDPAQHRGLSYFVVDMDLNGGLGGVALANQPVHKPATECLTVVKHANGNDYWLVAIDQDTRDFLIVPVTAAGVQAPFLQPRQSTNSAVPILKASPDGQYLAGDNELYRFDNANGTVTFLTDFFEASNYAFSFSPSSRYLYTMSSSFGDKMVRYDVTAADIAGSKEEIGDLGFLFVPGGMQIGPDGNLYFIEIGEDQAIFETVALSQIECPDAVQPRLNRNFFEFASEPGIGNFFGLPNFPDFLFVPGPPDEKHDTIYICAGDTVLLETPFAGETYSWSNGANANNLTVASPGIYRVTITNACGRQTAIHEFLVELKTSNPIEIPDVYINKCEGQDTLLVALPNAAAYQWSGGETDSAVSVLQPGTYQVTSTDACSASVQSFFVADTPLPAIEVRNSTQKMPCLGDTVRLEALAFGATSLFWSNGDTSATIRAAAGESYSVVASNACGAATASIEVPAGECCAVYIPNVFSPNGDGINDSFAPFFSGCEVLNYQLKVFSRWGAVVFESNNPDLGWDGTFRGKELPPDVFAFVLQYSLQTADGPSDVVKSGDVLILY